MATNGYVLPKIYTSILNVTLAVDPGIVGRTSAEIVHECVKYHGEVFIRKRNSETSELAYEQADAKKIMDLMALCAGKGSSLDIFVEGNDETARRMALRLCSGLETEVEICGLNFSKYEPKV
ncbi:MAG: HPr family phosphocarrier protein [archaeon]